MTKAASTSSRSPLVSEASLGSKAGATGGVMSPPGTITLSDMLASLEQNVVEKLKSVLTALHVRLHCIYTHNILYRSKYQSVVLC